MSIKEVHTSHLLEVYNTIQNELQQYNTTVRDANIQQFRERVQNKIVDLIGYKNSYLIVRSYLLLLYLILKKVPSEKGEF